MYTLIDIFRVVVSFFGISLFGFLQGEKLRREEQLVKDIADFLLLSQIPGFVSIFVILLKFVIESLFMFYIDIIIITVHSYFMWWF